MEANDATLGVAIDHDDFGGLKCPALNGSRQLLGVPAAVTATTHDNDTSEGQGRRTFTDLHGGHLPTEVASTINRQQMSVMPSAGTNSPSRLSTSLL